MQPPQTAKEFVNLAHADFAGFLVRRTPGRQFLVWRNRARAKFDSPDRLFVRRVVDRFNLNHLGDQADLSNGLGGNQSRSLDAASESESSEGIFVCLTCDICSRADGSITISLLQTSTRSDCIAGPCSSHRLPEHYAFAWAFAVFANSPFGRPTNLFASAHSKNAGKEIMAATGRVGDPGPPQKTCPGGKAESGHQALSPGSQRIVQRCQSGGGQAGGLRP